MDFLRSYFFTAKWKWDRSIYSIIKPSFDMTLFQYFWRFTQICKKFAAFAHKIVFVIVSAVKLFRNNNILRANAAYFLQICVNLQKYWNKVMSIDGLIIEYIYGTVSYSFTCTSCLFYLKFRKLRECPKISHFFEIKYIHTFKFLWPSHNVWTFLN